MLKANRKRKTCRLRTKTPRRRMWWEKLGGRNHFSRPVVEKAGSSCVSQSGYTAVPRIQLTVSAAGLYVVIDNGNCETCDIYDSWKMVANIKAGYKNTKSPCILSDLLGTFGV